MKESYVCKPPEVEVWPHGFGTDLILRKNFREEEDTGGTLEEEAGKHWECEEKQFRYDGTLTRDEVLEDFDSWWEYTENKAAAELTPIDVLTAKVDYIAMMCDVEIP